MTVPVELLPSPQENDAVCVSSTPASVNGTLAATAVPSGTGGSSEVVDPMTGLALVTVKAAVSVRLPSASETVTDDDGGSATVVHEYVVVYDATGGFATGGGTFQSPSGAYTPDDSSDPDVVGRARFAFVSKYVKGATTPSGTTAFRFSAGNLDFDSTSYDWMVVSGTKATYRGAGTVNGASGYHFMLAANDGNDKGAGVDQLRVRIWDDATGVVVYDNQAGAVLDAAPVTAIEGGQISVHK